MKAGETESKRVCTYWSQFCPSTFSLQVHIPVSGLHSGSLFRLPASRHSHSLPDTYAHKHAGVKTTPKTTIMRKKRSNNNKTF